MPKKNRRGGTLDDEVLERIEITLNKFEKQKEEFKNNIYNIEKQNIIDDITNLINGLNIDNFSAEHTERKDILISKATGLLTYYKNLFSYEEDVEEDNSTDEEDVEEVEEEEEKYIYRKKERKQEREKQEKQEREKQEGGRKLQVKKIRKLKKYTKKN